MKKPALAESALFALVAAPQASPSAEASRIKGRSVFKSEAENRYE